MIRYYFNDKNANAFSLRETRLVKKNYKVDVLSYWYMLGMQQE